MNERVQLILKTKNISASRFADEIGVQRSSISHIISGRNNPSLDFIQKILKRFPDINSDWLIFGKGSMHKDQDLFSTVDDDKTDKNIPVDQISDPQSDIFNGDSAKETVYQYNKEEEVINTTSNLRAEPHKMSKTIITEDKDRKPNPETKDQIKKVERIVIFYSDKTCAEYRME